MDKTGNLYVSPSARTLSPPRLLIFAAWVVFVECHLVYFAYGTGVLYMHSWVQNNL